METIKLYYENPNMGDFTAAVLSCREEDGGFFVLLDRTAFYPEGGGQPCDIGTLGNAKVLAVFERGGEILHLCDRALTVGARVEGCVDRARRFDFTQQHSADHIISGVIHSRFGLENVGFHMGADTTTIDLGGVLTPGELAGAERAANEAIWRDIPIETLFPSPEELSALQYRSKKELSGQVRLVKIEGVDLCACCGTHVLRTGEVGMIKIISSVPFRGGTRFEMVAGRRAYEYMSRVAEQNHEISALLSAKPLETAAAVRRLHGECEEMKAMRAGDEKRRFASVARTLSGAGDVLVFASGLSADGVRRLAIAVMENCGGIAAVFSGSGETGYAFAVGQTGGDLRGLSKKMNAALSGRGGGKPEFVQGRANASRAAVESFFGGFKIFEGDMV
ncbi:MAG: alanyl-tRNA editing protein [Oscillospiraceae bacterium]|nr:alanyl-tRNA editing protein [Oscillospiraceae bacterium]